ncbi:MAG TPA: LuxR C-terminal-related transcriptional regulator [Streptosporangiaceae bacterium]|jgi:LuxR family maltose regulon positive regulatory protein|nr:LuxR C-terminal-related transcriptional regulator [Streptosporangiaceae bacterium]
MTSTASKPVAPPRIRPQRLVHERLAQPRSRQARLRPGAVAGLPPLLEDKLRPPRLSLTVLRRRRVTDLLEAATAHRVTLVSGPAGAGKTVACASWAAARPAGRAAGAQAAWLTADAEDRDPVRFWQYVLAALVRARAVEPDEAAQIAAAPPQACPHRIVAAARNLPEPVVLVIDDAHELAGSAALAGLDQLIKHAPAGLRLVLAGRCPPGLALARLRVAGELADIGAADLACTAAEADAYFAMLGIGVAPAQRDELLHRTEGWMTGLRLAAMAAQPPAADPGSTQEILVDYVSDEVLGRQPADIRAFLLRTSVVQSLSGELADAVTQGAGGARTLERLARENTLVEPAGSGRGEYRYHPMLREVLTAELYRELPAEVPVLLGRAARWHAAHGQAVAAVRAAAQGGDWDYGAEVLADAGAGVLWPGGPNELEGVLAAFPPERRAGDAPVAAALAAARLWLGDAAGAAPHLECARRSLTRLDRDGRRVVEPWLTALRVMQGASQADAGPGWLAREWSRAEQAEEVAASVPEYRGAGLLWFALGCARLRRWEIGAARHALARASAQLAAGSLPGLRARAIAWQALAAARYGDLAAAVTMIDEVTADAVGRHPGVACPLALASAQVSLARDELDAGARWLDEADQTAGRQLAGEPRPEVIGGLIRAQRAIAEGDTAGARAVAARLREATPAGDEPLGQVLTLLEADIALAAGERERASLALSGATGTGDAAIGLSKARLLLATGDDKGALEAAQACLDGAAGGTAAGWAARGATRRDRLTALLIAAVAQRRLSQIPDAAESVEQALVLAEPDGAYRAFLDGGQAVRSAMTVLVPPTSACAGFAGRILERFDGQLPRPAVPAAAAGELPLTGSELAVLRFLPSHMTNQEIAEALFLSINTVKTHLRSAYRKLGVANRRQAIARGRRLDLL